VQATHRHVDRHLNLGDGVHGARQERGPQGDLLCDFGVEQHARGREVNVARQEQKVIVGQTTLLAMEQAVHGQAVLIGVHGAAHFAAGSSAPRLVERKGVEKKKIKI
jgi:hypothetical protein